MSAGPEQPSARAVERLATGVGEDVDDLRTQLHRALDEADRLQAAGRGDLAVSVLEEQRDALLGVHQRLEARLAGAAVEREAERVVDGAAPAFDAPDAVPNPAVPAGDDGMALRLVASAVAAVLGVALLLSPELGSGGLTAAGSTAASDAPQNTPSSEAGDATRDVGATPATTPSDRDAGAAERATDLRALALPEADVLATRARDEDDTSDADSADIGELVPLPDVGPSIDSLTPDTPRLPTAEDARRDQDTDEPDGDDGTAADDGSTTAGDDTAGDDTADQDARGDDTTSDEPEQDGGSARSSQDGAADDDGGTDGTTSQDDGSTSGDQTDSDGSDGSPDADGEDPSGGGLDLDDTGGEPTSLER